MFKVKINSEDGKLKRGNKFAINLKHMSDEDIFNKYLKNKYKSKDLLYFYSITGLTVAKVLTCKKRSLCIDIFGFFPLEENTEHVELSSSGFYNELIRPGFYPEYDIMITEEVEYISETSDYRNYIVIPKGKKIPFGNPKKDSEFEKYYILK